MCFGLSERTIEEMTALNLVLCCTAYSTTYRKITSRLNSFETRLDTCEEKVEKNGEDLEEMKRADKKRDDKIKKLEDRGSLDQFLVELGEREKRKTNIRITGVPETGGAGESERGEDAMNVIKIAKEIGVQLDMEDILGFCRLGKNKNTAKPRQLIATLAAEDKKTEVLKKCKALNRVAHMKNIKIYQDLTK